VTDISLDINFQSQFHLDQSILKSNLSVKGQIRI